LDVVAGCAWDAIQTVVLFWECVISYNQMTNNQNRHNEHMSALLTMSQIAERWQVSIETVKRRIRSGQLPALKLGRSVRVSPTTLVAYENNRKL
jgi:excisionase family DNA binding protein